MRMSNYSLREEAISAFEVHVRTAYGGTVDAPRARISWVGEISPGVVYVQWNNRQKPGGSDVFVYRRAAQQPQAP